MNSGMERAETKGRSYQVIMEVQVLMEGHVQRGKVAATAVQMADAAYLWGQVDVCQAQPLSLSGWDARPGWGWCAPSPEAGGGDLGKQHSVQLLQTKIRSQHVSQHASAITTLQETVSHQNRTDTTQQISVTADSA